jgi:hypothetical protein
MNLVTALIHEVGRDPLIRQQLTSDQLAPQRGNYAFHRAQADGDVLLSRQFLANHIRIAGMLPKPLAQPVGQAIQPLRPKWR